MFKTILTGNLTQNAEWKSGNQGDYLVFDVAVNLGKDKTQFVNCSISSKDYATKIAQYLVKGQKVLLDGMPKPDAYVNRDGACVAVFRLYVNTVELIGSKPGEQQKQSTSSTPQPPKSDDLDSDIPF